MPAKTMDLTLINRHWKEGFVYPFPEKRDLYPVIAAALETQAIISLVGLRRTGKTTLLKQFINHLIENGVPRHDILLYSFDEPAELQAVFDEYFRLTANNLDSNMLYFFLDEIQKLPDWQNKLKLYYDHYPNLKFIVSGSSSVFLRKRSESLAGRIREFWLPPLSFGEFLRFRGKGELAEKQALFASQLGKELEQFALRPFINILNEPAESASEYLNTLLRKVVFEDIPQVYPVEQPQMLLKIFQIIASNPGMLLDYRSLSSDISMNEKTLSNYVHYLEQAFLIKRLYNYSSNRLTSEKKLKKVYPLASAFCQAETAKVMEALAVTQSASVFFWRQTHEVDMVILENGKPLPIEVKYADAPRKKDLTGLQKFMERFHAEAGIVLTKQLEKREGNMSYIPLWKWLLGDQRGLRPFPSEPKKG